jgi:hypothetical protein
VVSLVSSTLPGPSLYSLLPTSLITPVVPSSFKFDTRNKLTISEECMAVSEPEPSIPLPCSIALVRKDGRSIIPTGLVYDHPPTQNNVKQQYQ